MSDTTPLTTLLGTGAVAAVLSGALTYLGVRRSSGVAASVARDERESRETVAREERESKESLAREQRINEQVDAFLATQTKELTDLRASRLLTIERLDLMSEQLRIAKDDIIVCQRQRADLMADASMTARRLIELTVSNQALSERVALLEDHGPPSGKP